MAVIIPPTNQRNKMEFKIGDKVRCISDNSSVLVFGQEYTIQLVVRQWAESTQCETGTAGQREASGLGYVVDSGSSQPFVWEGDCFVATDIPPTVGQVMYAAEGCSPRDTNFVVTEDVVLVYVDYKYIGHITTWPELFDMLIRLESMQGDE